MNPEDLTLVRRALLKEGAYTISDTPVTLSYFLRRLLLTLLEESDTFSSKRPFGDSGWDSFVETALQEIAPEADSTGGHRALPNEEYDRAAAAVIDYIFDMVDERLMSEAASDAVLPELLSECIETYGDKFEGLKEPHYQRLLSRVRVKGKTPSRADDYLILYLTIRDAIDR